MNRIDGIYRKSVLSVDERTRQHCTIGAKLESSSKNGRPKPRPATEYERKKLMNNLSKNDESHFECQNIPLS